MDDAPLRVAQAADQASKIVAHLGLRQRLPCLQHVGQRLQGPDNSTTVEEAQVSSRDPRGKGKFSRAQVNVAIVAWALVSSEPEDEHRSSVDGGATMSL